jgi:hypothetical protein
MNYSPSKKIILLIFKQPEEVPTRGTESFRVFQTLDNKKLSLWHDIPLVAGKSETGDYVFNYVNEITRGYFHFFSFFLFYLIYFSYFLTYYLLND